MSNSFRQLAAAAAALLLAWPALAGSNSYFTIDLPENWCPVAKENLAVFNQAEDSLKGAAQNAYCAAYQRKALLDFQLPYVLVEQERHAPYSKEELRAMAAALPSAIRSAYLPLHRAGKYGEVNVMQGFYDEERNMVFAYYEMTRAKPMEKMFAFDAYFPSARGLVKLHGFGRKADQERSMAEMEAILQSFRLGPGYAYVPPERRSSGKKILPGLCIAGIIILLGLRFLGRSTGGGRQPFASR